MEGAERTSPTTTTPPVMLRGRKVARICEGGQREYERTISTLFQNTMGQRLKDYVMSPSLTVSTLRTITPKDDPSPSNRIPTVHPQRACVCLVGTSRSPRLSGGSRLTPGLSASASWSSANGSPGVGGHNASLPPISHPHRWLCVLRCLSA